MTTALIDADRSSRRGRNRYTADTFVTDTVKQCSWCDKVKPHSEFHKDKKNVHGRGLAYYCKECANSKSRQHTQRNSESAEYKEKKKRAYIKNRYGLSLEDYTEKLVSQGFKCKICSSILPLGGSFTHLDHNHYTGKLRDFLCTNCNRGLGHFQDNMELLMKAAKYLEAHTENGTQKEGRCL